MHIRLTIALAAIVTALPAAAMVAAESWHRVGGNSNSVSYVDATSIRTVGATREAWAMSVFAKPIGDRVWSARIRYSIDCAGNFYRSLEYSHYGANDELLTNHPSSTSTTRHTPETGSIAEKMLIFVCTGQGGVKVSDPRSDAATVMAL